MKTYPSIPYWKKGLYGKSCYIFYKYDGTLLRSTWSKKRGFFKFGTKGQMIDENHEQWGEAVRIFLETYGDNLPAIFNKNFRNIESIDCFSEYWGYNSFAGNHVNTDKKYVTLFDISLYKKGMLSPKEFINNFGNVFIAEFLGTYTYNKELIRLIQSEYLDLFITNKHQSIFEGVVCKGIRKTKGQDLIWMCKVKNDKWLQQVKMKYGEKYLLDELNGDRSLMV
jgi:hypothetical protein